MNLKEAIANNKAITEVVTKTWKAGPTIAFIAGTAGSAASLYLMWKAARKHDQVVSESIALIEDVHNHKPEEDDKDYKALKAEYNKALWKAYIQAGFKLGKLYAPVAAAEVGSIWLSSYGYGKMHERYTNTLAMVTVMDNVFARYRQNVVDILGEDADRQFRYGLHQKEFEVPELDKDGNPKTDKNGVVKTKTIKEQVLEEDRMEGYSGYARIFGKGYTKQFDDDGGMATSYYNKEYLIKQQNFWNMMLKYRPNHTVFLNEVYASLGYDPTKEGQVVGWHYDPDHPIGDNEIRFVPIEFYDEEYETKSAILDFNVDGNVWTFL